MSTLRIVELLDGALSRLSARLDVTVPVVDAPAGLLLNPDAQVLSRAIDLVESARDLVAECDPETPTATKEVLSGN
jgi:hypothetical protein